MTDQTPLSGPARRRRRLAAFLTEYFTPYMPQGEDSWWWHLDNGHAGFVSDDDECQVFLTDHGSTVTVEFWPNPAVLPHRPAMPPRNDWQALQDTADKAQESVEWRAKRLRALLKEFASRNRNWFEITGESTGHANCAERSCMGYTSHIWTMIPKQ